MLSRRKLVLFVLLLPGSLNVVSVSKDVYCTKDYLKLIDSKDKPCNNPEVFLCQAILEGGVYLECLPCEKATKWTLPPILNRVSDDSRHNDTANNTLYLPPEQLSLGCYYCQCSDDPSRTMHISVTVEHERPITFVHNNASTDPQDHVMVLPEYGQLSITDAGWITMCCNATAYPDPHYNWSWRPPNNGTWYPYSTNPCLKVSQGGECLLFNPCAKNVDTARSSIFYCTVYNGVPDTNGTAYVQNLGIDIGTWTLHPHPLQSGDVIPLKDGVANGVVAAYNDWQHMENLVINYEICSIPPNITNSSSYLSCLRDQLHCCPCNLSPDRQSSSCPFNLTSYGNDSARDPSGLHGSTTACLFEVQEEMDLALFAFRCHKNPNTQTCDYSSHDYVLQLMGVSHVRSVGPTISPSSGGDMYKYILAGAAPGAFIVGIFVTAVCSVIVFAIHRRRRNDPPGGAHVPLHGNGEGGDGENANIDEQGHLREGGGGADTRVVTGGTGSVLSSGTGPGEGGQQQHLEDGLGQIAKRVDE